jgi:hypothetical protein
LVGYFFECDFNGNDYVIAWLANKLGYITAIVIYLCKYFIFIAIMCLLVVAVVVGVFIYVLPRNAPTLLRILIKIIRTLKNYIHIQLGSVYFKLTSLVFDTLIGLAKGYEDGFKKRLCLRVLDIFFVQKKSNKPDVQKYSAKKSKERSLEDPKIGKVKMIDTFNSFDELRSDFRDVKQSILNIKEVLGLL